jgi:hypothetical protein
MRLDDADAKTFPKFKNYLVFDFGQLVTNDDIIKGLMKWGKMSRDQSKSHIASGAGPKVTILDDKDVPLGSKQFHGFPGEINLQLSHVRAFEDKDTLSQEERDQLVFLRTGRGKKIVRVGLEILELLIQGHLFIFSKDPDDRDSVKVQRRLTAFEREVYGGVE